MEHPNGAGMFHADGAAGILSLNTAVDRRTGLYQTRRKRLSTVFVGNRKCRKEPEVCGLYQQQARNNARAGRSDAERQHPRMGHSRSGPGVL